MQQRRNSDTERILHSLDGMERASAPSHLFHKIEQRLHTIIEKGRTVPLRTVSLAAASLLLLAAINILMISHSHKAKQPKGDAMQQLVNYYGLNEDAGL